MKASGEQVLEPAVSKEAEVKGSAPSSGHLGELRLRDEVETHLWRHVWARATPVTYQSPFKRQSETSSCYKTEAFVF